MDGQLLKSIDEQGVTVASTRDSAGDEELVAAAKRGDEVAFETLVKRYRQTIFLLALRYTRVREDAEDIVQQTFQKAFVHLQKFEGRSSFSTWSTSIAINQALMLLRRRRALREVPIEDSGSDEGTTPAVEIADASPDPEASYLLRERTRILSVAMGQLRPGMRRAIELQELGELSIRETARYMGLSVAAVKARVFHARKKIGKALRCHMRSRRIPGSCLSVVASDAGRVSKDRLACAWN
jgi:RNA polymerase sigma-70 factor (ECF subfamily)